MKTFEQIKEEQKKDLLRSIKLTKQSLESNNAKYNGNCTQYDKYMWEKYDKNYFERQIESLEKKLQYIDEYVMRFIGRTTWKIIEFLISISSLYNSRPDMHLEILSNRSDCYYELGLRSTDVLVFFKNGINNEAINCFVTYINNHFATKIPNPDQWEEISDKYWNLHGSGQQKLEHPQIIVDYWESVVYRGFNYPSTNQTIDCEAFLGEREEYQQAKTMLSSNHHK